MLVDNKAAEKRLNSPLNLMNRLSSLGGKKAKSNDAMTLFTGRKSKVESSVERLPFINPFAPENSVEAVSKECRSSFSNESQSSLSLDTILEDSSTKIKLGLAHDKALDLLVNSVSALSAKLDDVSAGKLPQTILAASKVVESIRKERAETARNDKDKEIHYHFYVPEQKAVKDFEVIDVT